MNRIGVLIPCYNVERTVGEVLGSFSPGILAELDQLVAVDNSSGDGTFRILKELQDKADYGPKLVIIRNKRNYGLGGSQKLAYRYFIENGFSHFMIIHGDNQGNADEMARFFLEALRREPDLDLVLASRFHPDADTSRYDRLRRFGNSFFNFLTYLLTGHRMSDAGTGLMLVRTGLLERVGYAELTNSFQFNPQLNILLLNLDGLRTREVPLNWRDSEAGSNIRALQYCRELLKILLTYRVNSLLRGKRGGRLFGGSPAAFEPEFEIHRR
ncbi:MAG: glycosyltransferase family 2 protein [Elusimicrobia bacterium]|nr:glycosyltransferase family 2 protein [Elusimicrobiota bacterium]